MNVYDRHTGAAVLERIGTESAKSLAKGKLLFGLTSMPAKPNLRLRKATTSTAPAATTTAAPSALAATTTAAPAPAPATATATATAPTAPAAPTATAPTLAETELALQAEVLARKAEQYAVIDAAIEAKQEAIRLTKDVAQRAQAAKTKAEIELLVSKRSIVSVAPKEPQKSKSSQSVTKSVRFQTTIFEDEVVDFSDHDKHDNDRVAVSENENLQVVVGSGIENGVCTRHAVVGFVFGFAIMLGFKLLGNKIKL